jgi:hypothetical protein
MIARPRLDVSVVLCADTKNCVLAIYVLLHQPCQSMSHIDDQNAADFYMETAQTDEASRACCLIGGGVRVYRHAI